MSQKYGKRWEYVVGKALKDWATSIMHEGHTRAEAREMILADLREKTAPPGELIFRTGIKLFVRQPFWRDWTIGWDLKNRVILQFTKTVPYTPGKYHNFGLFFFRFSYASLTQLSDKGRYWFNIGWNV